ncbi:MAG: type II toxin-antitoxin system VapC family toxin [Methylohalobius sp.]|nr:type II toxin-antitoxin system VapC family toxin [Methylohalobius sp.]
MSKIVLDASAVLALVNDESGAERVLAALASECKISAVNVAEVLTRLIDCGIPQQAAKEVLDALDLVICPFDVEQAQRASWLRGVTRPLGLSLGDRACLALGQTHSALVITADRIWSQLDLDIQIECIRPS